MRVCVVSLAPLLLPLGSDFACVFVSYCRYKSSPIYSVHVIYMQLFRRDLALQLPGLFDDDLLAYVEQNSNAFELEHMCWRSALELGTIRRNTYEAVDIQTFHFPPDWEAKKRELAHDMRDKFRLAIDAAIPPTDPDLQ